MRALDLNRPAIAAASVGLAQGAFDAALAYAKQRKQFKRAIIEFQGIQFMLADMKMQIEAARALTYECARIGDAGDWQQLPDLREHGQVFRQRRGDEGHHRRGADLRRLRLRQRLPGRER